MHSAQNRNREFAYVRRYSFLSMSEMTGKESLLRDCLAGLSAGFLLNFECIYFLSHLFRSKDDDPKEKRHAILVSPFFVFEDSIFYG